MIANALVTTRISHEVKTEASKVLEAVGLTVSDAVRIFLTAIARDHTLSFNEIIPNKITLEAIQEAREGNLESAETIEDFLEKMNEED
jgi:DNA-damage-inducible protein J